MTEIKLTQKEEKEMLLKALFGSPFFNIFASVLATFIVGAVFFKYGGGVPIEVTSMTTEKASAFEVSGEGKVVVVPDQATVRMGVRKEGSNVEQLQSEANKVMQSLSESLEELGIDGEDIKTVNYSLSNRYGLEGQQEGYVIYAEVEVRVRELKMTSEVLDLVGRLGLERVGGLRFGLSDELEKEATREARELAIKEAKEKANELAKLSGMKLGKIVNVSEDSNISAQPYLMRSEVMMDAGESVPTPVEVGSSEVNKAVVLSYEIL